MDAQRLPEQITRCLPRYGREALSKTAPINGNASQLRLTGFFLSERKKTVDWLCLISA